MKAKITSKGQITIPAKIRKKLKLRVGQELEFDENAPYLHATKVVNEKSMRSVLGCLDQELREDAAQLIERMRGKVHIP